MRARRASAASAELPTKLRTRVAATLSDQRTIGDEQLAVRAPQRAPPDACGG